VAEAPTDDQVQELILLAYLTGISFPSAAYAVIPDFDQYDLNASIELSVRVGKAIMQMKLDSTSKDIHSSHIQQPEYVNAEKG
jgi:hypothetical protein